MSEIYVLVYENNTEWEDIQIYLDYEEAKQASKFYSCRRIEIFRKSEIDGKGYVPTHEYIYQGLYYSNK
jgi:hypothetical protein